MIKRPTQTDVAKRAGVSRATVSYVLNEQHGAAPVSAATRLRVMQAINDLGYEPDTRAQSLRSGHSKTIGLLVPDIHNPHYWQAIEGIEEEARAGGFDLLLTHSSFDRTREDYCLQALIQRTISGLIIIKAGGSLKPETVKKLLATGRPIGEFLSQTAGFDSVTGRGYRKVTRELMDHLLQLGHKNFAFINGVANPDLGTNRLKTYRTCLQEAGIPTSNAHVENCGTSTEEGYQATIKVLRLKPQTTAIIVINDLLAMGVVRAIYDLDLQVPKDISVASFDDIDSSNYFVPRLTTVRTDAKAEGKLLTRLLLDRLRDPSLEARTVELSARLIIRESTGKAAHS
ncbi:MAG: LacI family DNA-binding transcriptional regulator [Deinococcota bacterium]